jgi:hypothetical protein
MQVASLELLEQLPRSAPTVWPIARMFSEIVSHRSQAKQVEVIEK